MKPLIQKLPLNAETSFIAKTFRTPHFEVSWHQHVEYELILFTEGSGMSFIGNYVGEFKQGDVFFIGSNVPHTFQKQDSSAIASAVVVQFTDDFWGKDFLRIPESHSINKLFELSSMGIKLENEVKERLAKLIIKLETDSGFSRIATLCDCMVAMINENNLQTLATRQMNLSNEKYKQRLDAVFQFTITNFQVQITLTQIASLANMSVTAFCRYFKVSTKKSYIRFLNEIRIGYACKLLQDTDKTIIDICYDCGYNTPVNFNKQFIQLKKLTPGKFRNQFLNRA